MTSVLVLGLGSSGQRFVRLLRNSFGEEVEIFVLRRGKVNLVIAEDLQSCTAKDPSIYYGLTQIDSLDKLMNKKLDLIIIASISSSHYQDIQLVSQLNFNNILVEKPILLPEDVEKSSELVLELSKAHGCASGYFSRIHPLAIQLKVILRRESLGRPIVFRSTYGESIKEMHPYEDFSQSYAASKEMGGGPLNTFSHDLDLMLFLFDGISNFQFQEYKCPWSEIDVPEIQNLRALAEINAKTFLVDTTFDFVTWPKRRFGEMIFEFGKVQWDWLNLSIEVISMNTGLETYDFSNVSFPEIIQKVLESLLGQGPSSEELEVNWRDFVHTGVILSNYNALS